MHNIRPTLLWIGVAILALGAQESDAKRFGSGASSSAGKAVSKVEPGRSSESGSALRYGAAAAVGVAAGHAAAKALRESGQEEPEQKPEPSPEEQAAAAEQQRLDKLTDLERKAHTEEIAKRTEQILKDGEARRRIELATKQAEEKRRQDQANARRVEAAEQQAELKRQAIERELSCVIRPTMTDDEISHCKWAWSVARPE